MRKVHIYKEYKQSINIEQALQLKCYNLDMAELSSPEVTPQTFETQFSAKETVEFPEGKIDVVDVSPAVLKDPIPVLLAPGWSENQDTYKKSLKVIFEGGRRGITVGYARRGGEVKKHETYPQAELRKANQLLGVIEIKGIKRVDGIFHSEGAVNGLIAAMLRPDLFRNIVLDKPAGMIGEDGKTMLMGRFLKLMVKEAIERKPFSFSDPTNSVSTAGRLTRYMAGNPLRMWSEMDALITEDITNFIHHLESKGVKISIIAGVNDPLFPVKRQIEHMKKVKDKQGANLPIEGYYSVTGGHNELSIHAEAHTALAVNALDGLQRRQNQLDKLQG